MRTWGNLSRVRTGQQRCGVASRGKRRSDQLRQSLRQLWIEPANAVGSQHEIRPVDLAHKLIRAVDANRLHREPQLGGISLSQTMSSPLGSIALSG